VESGNRLQVWQFVGRVVLLEPVGAFGVGLWKNIKKGCDTFSGFVRCEVGDRVRTKSWRDLWCENTVLKVAFPILFGIAHAKDALVVDNMEILGSST
jgi:hypothetical protein